MILSQPKTACKFRARWQVRVLLASSGLAGYGAVRMQIKRDDRVRMERAHVLAWPALSTANIDGWLWRSSGGGSQRANSVSTVDFTGNNLDHAIDAVERRYCT